MAKIAGKYKVGESKNFYELLVELGTPEDVARSRSDTKYTLEVTVDGKNITMTTDIPPNVSHLVIGEEVVEKMAGGTELLSTTKLDGNVATVTSKTKEGQYAGTRTYTFTDKGIEAVMNMAKGDKIISATRYYNRI